MIIGVHLTALSRDDAARLLAVADIVTACASKHIREQVKPLVQVGAGYKKFAVTVADASSAEKLRELEKVAGVRIMIVGVHLTALSREDAARLLAVADIVTACASKHIREQVKPLVQVGTSVPLFGLTRWGKELLVERAKEVEQPLLINTMPLPVLPEKKQPRPLV